MKRLQGVLFGLVCALWLLCLLPAAWLGAMATSATGGLEKSGGTVLVGILVTLPLVLLLAPIAGLIARNKGRGAVAWCLVGAPLVWIVGAYALASYVLPQPS